LKLGTTSSGTVPLRHSLLLTIVGPITIDKVS
jgi:hypothetical protein